MTNSETKKELRRIGLIHYAISYMIGYVVPNPRIFSVELRLNFGWVYQQIPIPYIPPSWKKEVPWVVDICKEKWNEVLSRALQLTRMNNIMLTVEFQGKGETQHKGDHGPYPLPRNPIIPKQTIIVPNQKNKNYPTKNNTDRNYPPVKR